MLTLCLDCNKLIGCRCDHEPRRSMMPPHMPSVDPLFLAALRDIPKDAKDEDLPARARRAGGI